MVPDHDFLLAFCFFTLLTRKVGSTLSGSAPGLKALIKQDTRQGLGAAQTIEQNGLIG